MSQDDKIRLVTDQFQYLDFTAISELLENSYKLLNQNLELRDPNGKLIVSYPVIDVPLLADTSYQVLFNNDPEKGEIRKLTLDDNHCLTGLPIMKDNDFLGSLIIADRTPGRHNTSMKEFSEEKTAERVKFYQCITDFIAIDYTAQMETISLSEELANRYEELNLFYKLGDWLKEVQEIRKSMHLIIENITDTIEGDYGFITLPGKDLFVESGSLEGWNEGNDKQEFLKKLGGELLDIFSDKKIIILNDVSRHQKLSSYFPTSLGLISTPITINGLRLGALGICFLPGHYTRNFNTGNIRLLHSMTEVISILLKNIELYQNLKTFLVAVVKCLVTAIEAKDIYTRGHSERVNHISMLIANSMDMTLQNRENVNWASMLHDVGKIGIPEAILTKPGKLTDEEFAEIKKHPDRGYLILKPLHGFQTTLDVVRHHHERYDGRGYPAGLEGGKIPLHARIIAIADTYDAITSDRAYRKCRPHEEAVAEIERVAGTQLDPEIVKVFFNMIAAKGPQILNIKNIDDNQRVKI